LTREGCNERSQEDFVKHQMNSFQVAGELKTVSGGALCRGLSTQAIAFWFREFLHGVERGNVGTVEPYFLEPYFKIGGEGRPFGVIVRFIRLGGFP